jgi:hypothetical protein
LSVRVSPLVVAYAAVLLIVGVTIAKGGGLVLCSGDRPVGSPAGRACSLPGLAYPGSGRWWFYAMTPVLMFVVLLASRTFRRKEGIAAMLVAGGTIALTLVLCVAIGAAQQSFLHR